MKEYLLTMLNAKSYAEDTEKLNKLAREGWRVAFAKLDLEWHVILERDIDNE